MADVNDVLEACNELDERIADGSHTVEDIITNHLKLLDTKLNYRVPDFQMGLEWLNVSTPLSFKDQLQGKLVVLDFFTYCCVNCIHVLPDLEALEEQFNVKDGCVIIGVHSAKFENEKLSSNILSAVLRHGIHHPVVNDHEAKLWNTLQIACWPTFVIIGPSSQVLYFMIGEGHRERLLKFTEVALDYYKQKGEIKDDALPIKLERMPPSPLKFPGKLCLGPGGKGLVVSDTGNHRVVLLDKQGIVKNVIGSSERGYRDGGFMDAQFSSPQGVAVDGNCIYVADTDNQRIRKIDLQAGQVTTVVGTGKQGSDKEGGSVGTEQEISSPWDVCLGYGPDSKSKVLYIAMAGTHQVWAYFLQDTVWYKQREYKMGTCVRIAGSGIEENRNNSYPEKAGFSQPSGLAYSTSLKCLFVADSESSSVRVINVTDGYVKGLVGGDIDPRNLFAYGDIDGVGVKAKLQHPLGVALGSDSGPLLVADSYNHKIKTVDLKTKECTSFLSKTEPSPTAKADIFAELTLSEPGGLCVDEKNGLLYIADTNNCDIKICNLDTKHCFSLPIIFPDANDSTELNSTFEHSNNNNNSNNNNTMAAGEGSVTVKLVIKCAEGVHLNEEAPNTWVLSSNDSSIQTFIKEHAQTLKGDLSMDHHQTLTSISAPLPSDAELTITFNLFICEDSGTCRMDSLIVNETFSKGSKELTFTLNID